MENQHLMFKRRNGTSMLKLLLTIQTVPIVTVIASNILFVTGTALWFACPRKSHFTSCLNPSSVGLGISSKVRKPAQSSGLQQNLFKMPWEITRILNFHTSNKRTQFHIQITNLPSPCLALLLPLLYIYHTPTLAPGPEQIHFCGLWVKSVAEHY